MKLKISALLLALIIISCGNGQKDVKIPKLDESTAQELMMADFVMLVPGDWIKENPDNEFRNVQYHIKGHMDVKMLGFYFGDQPEMAVQNIDRWKNEFTEVEETGGETIENGIEYVTIKGDFKKKPFPMAEEYQEVPGYMTIAAIVPSNEGPYYFKMNGPEDVVSEQLGNFLAFLKSYKKLEV
ncbi:MAG: hypothetical protein ACOC2K_00595 [Bacteroidota bacterium]